jgi:hypothetical protein
MTSNGTVGAPTFLFYLNNDELMVKQVNADSEIHTNKISASCFLLTTLHHVND